MAQPKAGYEVLICETCGVERKGKSALRAHMQVHNPPPDPAQDSAAARAQGARPGAIVGTGLRAVKVAYSLRDLEAMYPKVRVIPNRTVPVTFAGITVQFTARMAIEVPSIFADILAESENEGTNLSPTRQAGDVTAVQVLPGGGFMTPPATEA